MTTQMFTKTTPPSWLLAMWKEIDDKTFGKGFDCFAENAVCNLGVADWHGRETIRNNLRAFIDTGFTAYHEVVEYWDSPSLKIFHGTVAMTFDDPAMTPRKPSMVHFFYMEEESIEGQPLGRRGGTGQLLRRQARRRHDGGSASLSGYDARRGGDNGAS
jgi:hypothetical protein